MYFRYDLYLHWNKARGMLTEYDTLISTNWWRSLVFECVILVLAPYPFLQGIKYHEYNKNWDIEIFYEYNQILVCFTFCRIYLILRYYLSVSKYMNPRSKRVCLMNGCEANHMFAMKAIMMELPFTFITISLTISIVLFGYQLHIFDGPLSEVSG